MMGGRAGRCALARRDEVPLGEFVDGCLGAGAADLAGGGKLSAAESDFVAGSHFAADQFDEDSELSLAFKSRSYVGEGFEGVSDNGSWALGAWGVGGLRALAGGWKRFCGQLPITNIM